MKKSALTKQALLAAASAALILCGCSAVSTVETPAAGTGEVLAGASTEAAETERGSQEAASENGNRLQDILDRGYMEVATEPYFAPFEFIDPSQKGDGQYVGADIEMAHYIADKLGVEVRIIPLDFTSVLSSVTEGKYDMAISALAYTPARAEAMELSKGYYYSSDQSAVQYGLLVRDEDIGVINTADDLGDRVVVCQSGSLQELMVTEQVPAYKELKRVSATTDGFLMVQENKADACVTAAATAQLYIDANPGCGMSIVPDFAFTVDKELEGTRIGIPKGETELLDRVNEILDEMMEEGVFVEWYNEYEEYAKSLGVA